jgi:hypothetical protein
MNVKKMKRYMKKSRKKKKVLVMSGIVVNVENEGKKNIINDCVNYI